VRSTPQDILTLLDDLGCRHYYENQLIQVAIIEPPTRFATWANSMLVYETKFARAVPSDELLYNIRLLRCMEGISVFAKLVGIVVDVLGKHLKSYLIEFPRTKWKLINDELRSDGGVMPWKRREQLARQLIDGVCQAHSKGFVIGTLWFRCLPISVDSLNCLQFWRFENKFRMGYSLGLYYPPEFRHLRDVSGSIGEAECPNITPKTDIFHLGRVLHFLTRSNSNSINPFGLPEASEVDHIALPRLPGNIPLYYRNMIDLCRAEDPHQRPPAWRLLAMFPPTGDSWSSSQNEALVLQPETVDIDSLKRSCTKFVGCDSCSNDVGKYFFHCNICRAGDFDICVACFDRGLHCYERDHFLVEMVMTKTQSWIISGK
jgi:hypothetical protein